MRTSELMIGDWVLHEGEPYQIRQLGIFGENRDGEDYPAVCIGKPKGVGLIVGINEIEPIPLTPEILEKNGFVKVGHYYPYPTYEYKVESLKFVVRVAFPKGSKATERTKPFAEVDAEWCWYNNDCEFLHNLQQVMRLCRIKKEIVI